MRLTNKDLGWVRDELLEKQNHQCAICDMDLKEEPPQNKHVDHDHETGMIRGILCQKCNLLEGTMLYRFRRSGHVARGTDYKEWVRQLLDYLEQPQTLYEHPSLMSDRWKHFKRQGKEEQLRILAEEHEYVPETKMTKAELLKVYKKLIK